MTDSAKANDLLAQLPKGKGPAPVHLWNPDFCGHIDMRIARDGTWFYQGTPIGRKPMVKLFSNIIRRDGDDYFLVTPVEKVGISVDDAPFVAVTLEVEGQGESQVLRFTSNVDEQIEAGLWTACSAEGGFIVWRAHGPAVQNPRGGPAPKIIHKESKADRFPTPEQLDQLPGRPRGEKPALLTRNR